MVAGSCRQPQTYVKPEAAITVFELLMMGGVSPETCWAINPSNAELNPFCHLLALLGAHHILHLSKVRVKKLWNNKFYYTFASCWFFLYDLCSICSVVFRWGVPVRVVFIVRILRLGKCLVFSSWQNLGLCFYVNIFY